MSKQHFDVHDIQWMARALQLARRGKYATAPNPCVGCVFVKDGILLSEGWHEEFGGPHAEINALQNIAQKEDATGATVYVNLEPCAHQGKTPPCADALIAAKVQRVVVAMRDPNPLVSGQGIARLQAAGIVVDVGLLATEAKIVNASFLRWIQSKQPWVRLKSAMSFDGRTAMASGESKWITGVDARRDVQRLRAKSAAIITGIGTVLADDPALTVRDLDWPFGYTQPMRVILDSQLRIDLAAKILQNTKQGKVVIFTCDDKLEKQKKMSTLGVEVIKVPAVQGKVSIKAVLTWLGESGINEVLVEAGAQLTASFILQDLVDEMVVYVAPKLLGSKAKPLFDLPYSRLQEAVDLEIIDTRMVGNDVRYTLQRRRK